MKKRILITGANGFVGYHLITAALYHNLEVFAGIRKNSSIEHLKDLDIKYSYLDYTDIKSLKDDFTEKKYDYIIHAAGATKAVNYEQFKLINAEYTKNIAIAAQSIKPQKLVFISSLAAIGPSDIYSEDKILATKFESNPITSYGRSKLLAEQYLSAFTDVEWLVIRPTAVYGPREKDLLILMQTINKGFDVYLGGKPQTLSFIYVEDLAYVTINACLSDAVHQYYNISDGKKYSTYDLSSIIKKELKRKTIKITIPISILKVLASLLEKTNTKSSTVLSKEKINELTAESWYCSIEKAQKELSFTPEYDLHTGMKNTIDWYKKNKWI